MNGRDIIGEVWLLSGKKEYIHDNALFLLNRATTQVLLDLNVWNDEYSKNSVVGVQYYELPSDTLEVVGVSFDGDPLGHKNYNALKTTYESNYTPTFYAITNYLRIQLYADFLCDNLSECNNRTFGKSDSGLYCTATR